MVVQPAQQQPGMMAQMAATAGSVAVGSTVGHVVGAGITSMFGGGSSSSAPSQAQAPPPPPPPAEQVVEPPCSWEIKQFIECAQKQPDLSLCEGFNEAMKQCRGVLSTMMSRGVQ